MLPAVAISEQDFDQVLGLELGADDYVIKPVEPRVLLARINALFRRSNGNNTDTPDTEQKLVFGNLSIDRNSRVLVRLMPGVVASAYF